MLDEQELGVTKLDELDNGASAEGAATVCETGLPTT
jgi:hypothetical protein